MQLCVRRLSALLLLLSCPSSLVTAKRTKHLRSPSQTTAVPPRDLQEAPECFRTLDWTSEKGELLVNGHPFHLKGTSWFGFETANEFPHGLWSVSADDIFGFLRNNSFNAVRLPVSAKLVLDPNKKINANVVDKSFKDLTAMQLISAIMDKAAKHDILIMLDMHRLNEDLIPELWYDGDYGMPQLLQAWDNLLGAVGNKWNLFALDIKNEPHGMATWGAGSNETDWNSAAETIIEHIYTKHPSFKGLVFVEGVQMPTVKSKALDKHNKWWGGDLEGVWDKPIDLGNEQLNKRVVYSPHVYGPGVFEQEYFLSKHFPSNMGKIWHDQWAFVEAETDRAVVLGEWGGHYENKDKQWQDALADYLVDRCLEDTFYWCLNPNSGDTGGLLDFDFKTPITPKLELLARVQPSPSWLSTRVGAGDKICFTPGEYANPRCKGGSGRAAPAFSSAEQGETTPDVDDRRRA